MKHVGRKLLLPVAAVALAGGSFAFLASNTVQLSHAGEGTGTIAGYTAYDIHYSFNATNQVENTVPGGGNDSITQVTFKLDNAASQVSANIVSRPTYGTTTYSYHNCTSDGAGAAGSTWTCTTGGDYTTLAPNDGANILSVSAAS